MQGLNEKKGLDKYLSRLDVGAISIGCMVGWGAFVMPGTTFLPVAGPAGTVLAMLIGTIVIYIIASSLSYLMERNTGTGGIYNYTKEVFGRDHAFICSWFLCLSYLTIVFLNGTALFVVVRTILGDEARKVYLYTVAGNDIYLEEVGLSVLALAGVGFLFIIAKPFLQKLLTFLAIVLVAGSVIISVMCLPHAFGSGALHSFGFQGVSPAYAVFSLVILAPWAFVGFEVVSFDTAHYKFPVKKSRGVIFLTVLLAGFIYIAMSLVSIATIPDGFASWQDYLKGLDDLSGAVSVPTFYAAREIMGPAGLFVIVVTASAAIMTGIIGAYRALVRVLSTMAEDRILSERFSKTSYSILFVMLLSVLIVLLGRNTLTWFVDLTSFGAIVAYGYTAAAALKTAQAEADRKHAVIGIFGLFIAAAFVLVQLVPRISALEAMGSEDFLLLSLWCLLGFVFYWRTVKSSPLAEFSGMSISGIILFSLLMYSVLMWFARMIYAKADLPVVQDAVVKGSIILLLISFCGLVVMLYLQNLVRKKHEISEREKIRAVEGSLAKSQFLFNMSHDIRTPMNAIIGYTNLAMKEENSPAVDDYLTKINRSSEQLLELINDILEMSRIESGKVELEYAPTDLTKIFDEMRMLFTEQMKEKEIDFSVQTEQVQHRYVWCDRKNLNRVLLNLISNAYKFTPRGGTIRVSLGEIISTEENPSFEIRVQDSGIGMAKGFVDKMFTAFERERTSTDSGVEGTGLGLAITKSIVDLMGGTIEVLTSPGSGTQMIIRLKMKLADEEEVTKEITEEAPEEVSLDPSEIRILVVEDNEINMEIAKMILTQAGFMVETAQNGQVAVDMILAAQPWHYDAVLMDIQMPVMDGYTATKMIRAMDDPVRASLPIAAMTANAFKEDEQAAEEAGMQAHIAKPIDVQNLVETLERMLRDRQQD